jgi:hypothetical protein
LPFEIDGTEWALGLKVEVLHCNLCSVLGQVIHRFAPQFILICKNGRSADYLI